MITYARRRRDPRLRPTMDWRPEIDGGAGTFDDALAGAGMGAAPSEGVYVRPRSAAPPVLPTPAYELEASSPVSPPAPVTYSRPRMVEEPADELTKIAETRDYHANQHITNDDPWWKNLLKGLGRGALSGLASGRGLAGAAGGAAAGGIMGLAMPAWDDRVENQGEVAKLDDRYATEYGRQKGELGLEGMAADVEYKRRRPDLEAEKIASRSKEAATRNLVTLYNRLPEFDPEAPENADLADQMRAAGLPVVRKQANQQLRFVQDARTGAWSVIAAPKTGGEATAAAVVGPDGKPLATTSPQSMTDARQREAQASRERIAQWRIKAQKEIAAANQAIQRDRVRLDDSQFKTRYPGAGLRLTPDDIARKAAALKMLPEDVAKDAVKQGYTIADQ